LMDDSFSIDTFITASLTHTGAAWDAQTVPALLGLSMFWLLRLAVEPAYFNRVLSSENPGVAKRATLYNAVFIVFWMFVMLSLGNLGQTLHPDTSNTDQLLLHLAAFHYNDVFYGIFIVVMIGVVMSTQDSLLNSASIVFTVDMLMVFNPDLSDRAKLTAAKASTLAIGLTAMLIAIYVDSVLQSVIWIFSVYIPTMLPVIVFSIYSTRPHWQAALVSMATGFVMSLYWEWSGFNAIAPSTLVALICSTAGYVLVHGYMRRRNLS